MSINQEVLLIWHSAIFLLQIVVHAYFRLALNLLVLYTRRLTVLYVTMFLTPHAPAGTP